MRRLLRRFFDWLAAGRPALEIVVGDDEVPRTFADVLVCRECHHSYVARPAEKWNALNLCRACAAKKENPDA